MANGRELLMAHRAAMMGGKPLPYDAEVEWIENTLNDWISTGITVNKDGGLFFSGEFSKIGTTGAFVISSSIFGSCATSSNARIGIRAKTNKIYVNDSNGEVVVDIDDIQSKVVSIVSDHVSKTITIDGNEIPFTGYGAAAANSQPVGIFCLSSYSNGVPIQKQNSQWKGRIHSFSIVNDSGVLLIDFIPVRFTNENGDDEGAMYDRVSGKLFRNQGTGAFVIGPDKTV